jgi:hypothetical protein
VKIVLLFALLLVGCSEDELTPRSRFELENGEVVTCRWIQDEPCGITLTDCDDGKKYTCQTNITEL